ncbi:protein EARLY RESPONSIVE TO DEHYDRATION 15-like isoform X1 [Lycium ferocissimum]|uniref:protein EARLY RESPONSIVE TO DEHYDRATION 15-like isoform X1 n=1 Tax=Lycium ferocissimum TaxID=112874 RepID=UPI002814E55E|nr:protein EARLY RESPONSIVE TO DEHYDRATION 15-like isoform X1 [Lycium ferocissimum]
MGTSTLNPNAPIFIPSEYREVEDFSDHWWDLVHTSPWFRHYWLRECYSDPDTDTYDPLLPHIDFVSNDFKKDENKEELITLGVLKWNKSRIAAEIPRYGKQVPKIVNVKVTMLQGFFTSVSNVVFQEC